ncbi:MAG: response regulator transcription factor [Gammaproteobacteria bacterium]|nr:response regulator transcription factor [Gammaproteobacteria bacterium]MBU1414659.1 response regulator transcription factor [Gammaproteobacteria bacterium]
MTEPICVLLADDHPLFREGVAHSLANDPGFEVVAEADCGEVAVDKALALKPALVLLDINMPGIGGIVAAERIAAALPATRIMMLTVNDNDDSLLAALKAGAHGYVLKGVAAAELRAIAHRIAAGEAYVTPTLAAEMLAEFARPRQTDNLSDLTPREAEVLELLSQGLSNRQIGESLQLAEKTVKHHMTNILQKLQVRSRTEAAIIALQRSAKGSR